jgi:predicted PurR-regulated permease PerM
MSDNDDLPLQDQPEKALAIAVKEPTSDAEKRPGSTQQLQSSTFPARITAGLNSARALWSKPIAVPISNPIIPVEEVEESDPPRDIARDIAKWTLRRDIPLAFLAWAAVIFLLFWLASQVVQTILVLVIASLLAYALVPLVSMLERFMPRLLAVIIVYVVVLAGIGTLLYFVISNAIVQISSLTGTIKTFMTPTQPGQLTPFEQFLQPLGITSQQIGNLQNQLIAQLGGIVSGILPLLTGIAGAAVDVFLVIILSIYLLFEGPKVTAWIQRGMPRSQRGRTRFLVRTLQRVIGGYIRGQIVMSSLIGVLVGVGMLVAGVPYALLLGVLAFILEFIPTLGTLTSGLICVLLALTRGWLVALIVLAYFVLVHIFEGDIVGPRIIGKAVGLSPMVSMIALVAASELFGIPGALFASPVAGILQALIITLWSEWREAHPEEFQDMKQQVGQVIQENTADHQLSTEAKDKLLS